MNLVITQTKNGVRAHRATCKRQGASISVDDATNAQIKEATPASCCKPTNIAEILRPAAQNDFYAELNSEEDDGTKADDFYADLNDETPSDLKGLDVLDDLEDDFYTSSRDKAVEEAVASAEEIKADAKPAPTPASEPNDYLMIDESFDHRDSVPATKVVFGWKDYFWSSLGRGGVVVALNSSPCEVTLSVNNAEMFLLIQGTSDEVQEKAAEEVEKVWRAGRAAVQAWVRTDEYKRVHGDLSPYSYATRRAYLRGFCDGFAGEEPAADYTEASSIGYMHAAGLSSITEDAQ